MTATIGLGIERYAASIARAVRICNHAGIMDMNGHVSQRDPDDPNVFYINSRKASRSTLTAADVVPFDIAAGTRIGPGDEAPSEFHIHREIYKKRPDVAGILHSHPEMINTLTIAGRRLQPVNAVGIFLPEDGAPVLDTAVLINTVARGAALAEALGDAPIVVLRQHGTVTVGDSFEQAIVRMWRAENNATALYRALAIGSPRFLTGEELAVLRRENLAPLIDRKFYHYLEETAARAGALDGV